MPLTLQAFRDKTQYRLLTRLMGPYRKSAEFFCQICQYYSWKTISMLYYDNTTSQGSRSDCYFILESFFFEMQDRFPDATPFYQNFDTDKMKGSGPDAFTDLLMQVRLKSRSKITFLFPFCFSHVMSVQRGDIRELNRKKNAQKN
jgi:hypothetical protein